MIVEERMKTYINSLDMGNTPFLQELEAQALANRVPIIRRDMQSFMRMLQRQRKDIRICMNYLRKNLMNRNHFIFFLLLEEQK